MSQIILPGDINEAQMAARQQVAEEQIHEEMFASMVKVVTENVIANLINSPMGIVYYGQNGEVVSKAESLGHEPERQNERDSGYDLKTPEAFTLEPNERKTIGLKIGLLIPSHMDMLILPRSGNANKFGIMVVNSPGLVDNSYVGYEIKVILLNTSGDKVWKVHAGDRIAQARFQLKGSTMFIKEYTGDLKKLQDTVSSRTGGFGSTGA